MNALAASASVRCVVTRTAYLMLARRYARSSTVTVFQAVPVDQTFWKPERIRTAALVSAVRIAITLVRYASTKAGAFPAASAGATLSWVATRPAADAFSTVRREIGGMGTPRCSGGKIADQPSCGFPTLRQHPRM